MARLSKTLGGGAAVSIRHAGETLTAIAHHHIPVDGLRLHVAEAGPRHGAPMILLHGFPDHWIGWRPVADAWADRRWLLAPDGRGINLSDAPAGASAYALERLIADVIAIADTFGAGRFDLMGHDWGGVVAWVTAQRFADRVRRLVVINAPHPYLLARALARDVEQQRRSAYIHALRAPDAESRLTRHDFQPLRAAFDPVCARPDFDAAAHRAAWSLPGRLTAALNWYRAAAFLDDGGASVEPSQALKPPTLLVWGARDQSFAPDLVDAHQGLVSSLRIERFEALGHWPHQEAPDVALPVIADWLDLTDN